MQTLFEAPEPPVFSFWKRWTRHRFCVVLLATATLAVAGGTVLQGIPEPRSVASHRETIPAAEFVRIIEEFSEEGGYFFSDNFTSNESAYVYVLDKLQKQAGSGGAYVGVGPEQNFTYIAKLRPQIAFIVDIRRQAMIQHLMYKAIFHWAENRAEFLSLLFSKPLAGRDAPKRGSPIERVLDYFAKAPSSAEAFAKNWARLQETIQRDFRFLLSPDDLRDLRYVYEAFYRANLQIAFRLGGANYGGFWGYNFPTLVDLIVATDGEGKMGNFLVREEDYAFVRKLHRQNRIIPVVGDFSGTKALAAVAGYLRQNGYPLTAFYTSNVEQFLFDGSLFPNFVANIRRMPLTERSVILRSVRARGRRHPAYIPGHRMTPLLQFMSIFLQDYDRGLYTSYWELVTTHYM
jgi:hypothetical protein